jgi:TctA family transporter
VAESELRAGLMASAGSLMPLIERPIACAMLVLSAALFAWPFVRTWRRARLAKTARTTDVNSSQQGGRS